MAEWKAVTLALNPKLMDEVREYCRDHPNEYLKYSHFVSDAIERLLKEKKKENGQPKKGEAK